MKKIKYIIIPLLLFALLAIPVSAANYNMTNQYNITSAAYTYFRNVLGNAPFGTEYIIFQNSQYITMMFIGKFTVSGNVLTCVSGQMITYNSNMPNTNRRYITQASGVGHTITTDPQLIFYTNVKGLSGTPIPASAQEGRDRETQLYLKYILHLAVLGVFLYTGFQFIRKRWLGVW